MAIVNSSIDDFCRLCAIESQSGVTIYSAEGENLCLEEKIINCLRIEISRDDMLPKRVCQSCNMLLEDYYRFTERATQVQQTLYFLLGLHLQHSQEPEPEMCLMDGGVKVESNLIKKELDDFILSQSNIQVDGEKIDVTVSRDDLLLKDQEQQFYDTRLIQDIEIEEINNVNDLLVGSGETKQGHRRKMSVPKKTVLEKSNEIVCLEEKAEDSQEFYKILHLNEKNDTQGLNSEDDDILSSEDDEENRRLELEWRKQYGILCNHCQNVFPDRLAFNKHYRVSHKRKPVYTCAFCKNSVDKFFAFKSHVLEHIHDGRFRCKFCEKKFCSKEMLQIHSEVFHSQIEIFACDECGMSFTSQPRLNFHQKKHENSSKKELRCTECGKVLQTRGGLAAHTSVHKLGRHFMCHICGKTFTQKINMQQHVKHHKGEKPHVCDICDKSFAEKSHLNRHKSFHTKDRPYQCSVCKKMYKTERCLKVHSKTHWNSRPYICSVCGKGFLSSTKLKQHYNCHTGERPFACKYCEKTFTNYPNWLKHTRRRHKVDHKTGLSLKVETQTSIAVETNQITQCTEIPKSTIEFIEMPEIDVKEDGPDSVQSHHSVISMISSPGLNNSKFQVLQNGGCRYQMNLLPDSASSQVFYTDHTIVDQETLL